MSALGLMHAAAHRHGRYDRLGRPAPRGMLVQWAATPMALIITEVAAVPLPAAVWLFGSALVGLLGLGRRQSSVDGGLAA